MWLPWFGVKTENERNKVIYFLIINEMLKNISFNIPQEKYYNIFSSKNIIRLLITKYNPLQ